MLVQIILFDNFDLLDVIGPFEVFQAAGMHSGGALGVELVSMAGARLVPSGLGGLELRATGRPDLDRAGIILVPGAAGSVAGDGPDTVAAVLGREAAGDVPGVVAAALGQPGMIVATVCGGSLIPAMAGLLRGRPAVTHHMGLGVLETAGAIPVRARVVDDGNLVTGGGVTSGIDVALHLVERALGPRIAHAVEALFEHERRGTVWRNQGMAPASLEQPAAAEAPAADAGAGDAAPGGVAGRWNVSIATPVGKQAVVYDITVAGGAVAGTATQGGETTPLLDMAASGNRLTWSQHVTRPMKLHLRFDVVVNGDVMTGTAKAGMLPASKLTGVRRNGAAAA